MATTTFKAHGKRFTARLDYGSVPFSLASAKAAQGLFFAPYRAVPASQFNFGL